MSFSSGMTPASESVVALTKIMNRIVVSPLHSKPVARGPLKEPKSPRRNIRTPAPRRVKLRETDTSRKFFRRCAAAGVHLNPGKRHPADQSLQIQNPAQRAFSPSPSTRADNPPGVLRVLDERDDQTRVASI